MLFRRKIAKSCSYCAHGTRIDCEQVLCIKKGVVPINGKCMKFSYDPCKRVPCKPKTVDFAKYDKEDFSL